jgi:protein-S-isoprenylcysteine O-methyltransferase Ste14
MSHSASTPRLRLTAAYYGLLIVAAGTVGPRALPHTLDVLLGCAALLIAALAALGRIWSSLFIAGRKDTELVTSGPYAVCRHPLYALSLLGGFALGLATRSMTLTFLTLVVLGTLLARAVAAEERALASRHPQAFTAYASQVPRWWPRWRNWQLPADARLSPQVLWKAFVDAGAFLLLFALVEAAQTLRTAGVWPTLLHIP